MHTLSEAKILFDFLLNNAMLKNGSANHENQNANGDENKNKFGIEIESSSSALTLSMTQPQPLSRPNEINNTIALSGGSVVEKKSLVDRLTIFNKNSKIINNKDKNKLYIENRERKNKIRKANSCKH